MRGAASLHKAIANEVRVPGAARENSSSDPDHIILH